jgi:hypothetical protein
MISTIITMYFNIENKNMEDLALKLNLGNDLLSVNNPMIIFCDKMSHEIIKKNRINNDNTYYVVKELQEYEYFNLNLSIINDNINRKKINNQKSAEYYLYSMFKPYALRLSKILNPFNTKYFAWIDFIRDVGRDFLKKIQNILDNPRPKVSLCYIHYRGHNELLDKKKYFEYYGKCGIVSLFFTIDIESIDKLYSLMLSIFNELLYDGYGNTDDIIMTYSYDRLPELFNIYYGDYYSIYNNYYEPIEDINAINHYFINETLAKNRLDLTKVASSELIKSIKKNEIKDFEYLLDNLNNIVNRKTNVSHRNYNTNILI